MMSKWRCRTGIARLLIISVRIHMVQGNLYQESQGYNAAHNADIIIIPKPAISCLSRKTLIEIHREGNYFVAIDLLTNVADRGLFGTRGPAKQKRKVLRNITRS